MYKRKTNKYRVLLTIAVLLVAGLLLRLTAAPGQQAVTDGKTAAVKHALPAGLYLMSPDGISGLKYGDAKVTVDGKLLRQVSSFDAVVDKKVVLVPVVVQPDGRSEIASAVQAVLGSTNFAKTVVTSAGVEITGVANGSEKLTVTAGTNSLTEPFQVNLIPPMGTLLHKLYRSTGLSEMNLGQLLMILVGLLLIYLAIAKGFEPLLLLPIGFGAVLSNIPIAGISGPDGLIGMVYTVGVKTGVFPLLIFMGVGAMTDFGPLIANPKTALLGAAAQFGIFATLIGALALNGVGGINFSLSDAASIGIIGGADGPTAIFLTSKLAPHLLGAIAVAAYSYMALVPIIQPPIIRALTTKKERLIKMEQLRHVSKTEKVLFPLIILALTILLLPDATPLIGMLMFGNLLKESGVVDRLSKAAQNELINIVTIFLGLAVGSKLQADQFLKLETLGILLLGLVAFSLGTATGVLFGKLMAKLSGGKVNPMIGAAGVSAVPMAARVVNGEGLKEDKTNFLLMHAMGPNVSGVIGSAVAAGILLSIFGG